MADWREELRQQGWVHRRNVVDPARVEVANDLITQDLAMNYDPERRAEYDSLSACPDVRGHVAIEALYGAPGVSGVLEEVLGLRGCSVDPGQIAVRWPRCGRPVDLRAHIDGVRTADNGVRGPLLATFTALVGIFLTPSHGPWSGNFTVWPGSLRALKTYFEERGRRALVGGMPDVTLGQPLQLEVQPGDVVICNYLLMHGCSANTSEHQRRAVFFRVRRRGLALHPYASLVDPWRDWR